MATQQDVIGYEYYFVETPPDRLVCKMCHLPSRNPYLSVCCGHLFCKSCLDRNKTITVGTTGTCSVMACKEKFITFPQTEADREIKKLHVYCTNKEKGCEWQGELSDINNHLRNIDGCQFEGVKCPNDCGKMIERQYLTNHVRTECPHCKITCQYCHVAGEHQFVEGRHKEECPKLPLPCPNKCEVESVPREDMEVHRKECPLEMIQCEYHSVGCEVRMARKDQEQHRKEKMEDHLTMATHNLSRINDIHHDLTGTQDELSNTKNELAGTKTELAGTRAQLSTALEQINNLTILVNAQLSPATNFKGIRSVQLDAIVAMFKTGHRVCPVTIKMSEYNNKRRNNVEWYSDAFYTHSRGYKMCLRIDAGGISKGRGTHLSTYLYLMKGPHDDELTWPLRAKLEIKLLNQITDNYHYVTTVAYDNQTKDDAAGRVTMGSRVHGRGKHQFISNENLYRTTPMYQYLKNDCLYFQVTKF